MATGFFWDEACFWHAGGNYSFLLPVGGLVQPSSGGGLPENPETKRRLMTLMHRTGLVADVTLRGGDPVSTEELLRVHPQIYLTRFRTLSEAGGGELGVRAPFGPGGYDIARISAGLARSALMAVLRGELRNAYALCRPPGHHCLPDFPNGFCLLNNIAIAIESARAAGLATRFAVIDWDVHHGNGTEAIFYDRADVLTISLHQARNYPYDTGDFDDRGQGPGRGKNLNIPLPPGAGHASYLEAFARLVMPAVAQHQPDVILVACGYDASGVDPLSRMLASSDTFREMTRATLAAAERLCGGRLILVHEGGYSETHVPFCGHAVLEELSGSAIRAEDPLAPRIAAQQPDDRFTAHVSERLTEMVQALDAGGAN